MLFGLCRGNFECCFVCLEGTLNVVSLQGIFDVVLSVLREL